MGKRKRTPSTKEEAISVDKKADIHRIPSKESYISLKNQIEKFPCSVVLERLDLTQLETLWAKKSLLSESFSEGTKEQSDFKVKVNEENKDSHVSCQAVHNFLPSPSISENTKDQSDFKEEVNEKHKNSHSSSQAVYNFSQSPSSNCNLGDKLHSVIDKVKNLQLIPSVYIETIETEGKGISAVDIDQSMTYLAYSPAHSPEIHFLARKDLSDNCFGSVNEAWSEYLCSKKQNEKHPSKNSRNTEESNSRKQKMSESFTFPNEYFIKQSDVTGLCFSTDSSLLLSCSLDGSVKVINTSSCRVVQCYDNFGYSTDIHVSSDCSRFATANVLFQSSQGHVVYLYSFEKAEPVISLFGHSDTIKCIRFHPNGLYMATASSDCSIKLWCVRGSKEVRNFKDNENAHPEKLAFSPDGKFLASTYNGLVKIWDLATGKKLHTLKTSDSECSVLNICYNSDGSVLAAGGSDKKFHLWNVRGNESLEAVPEYDLVKSESLERRIFCIKYIANFFACVTA